MSVAAVPTRLALERSVWACLAAVFPLLLARDATATAVTVNCISMGAIIRDDTGSGAGNLAEDHGCPGPLSAHRYESAYGGDLLATLSASDGSITHLHSSTDSQVFFLYFVSVVSLEIAFPDALEPTALLRIVPELAIADAYVWNAWFQIEDQTTGERFGFFSGNPIDPYDANFLGSPPIDEVVLSLATGRSYWISSRFKTTARTPLFDHTGFFSLAFAPVPEPSPCLLVVLGLTLVAARRTRTM